MLTSPPFVMGLKFTPLEFETIFWRHRADDRSRLKFTPLEFETGDVRDASVFKKVKIYSVGV